MTARYIGNNGTLAVLYVSTGADVSFHSTLNYDQRALGGWGLDDGNNYQGDFTTATAPIPEPSTLFWSSAGWWVWCATPVQRQVSALSSTDCQ